ncbi:MAG: hypothetical protein IJW22_02030, partial [Clostridia bacterium]|nr:hypothetical protein [Clostridia bacterium]
MRKTSIKEELYEYIRPSKRLRTKSKRANAIKSDLIMYAMIMVVLVIYSLPLFLEKTLLGCLLFGAYIVALILNLMDKDPYTSLFFYLGVTLLEFAIVISYMVVGSSVERFELRATFPLILFTVILILFYEFFVLYNILSRRYTAKNEKKSYPAGYTALGTLTGGLIASRLVSRFSPLLADSVWTIWIGLFTCALCFSGAFICFQKYLLYRFTKEKNT